MRQAMARAGFCGVHDVAKAVGILRIMSPAAILEVFL
jgi:hypothetical protein